MTTHEKDTKILKDHVEKLIDKLEKGNAVYVTGGHIQHGYNEYLIESNCSKIINKLRSLGYGDTNNNGHGCKNHRFTKKIDL